MPKQNIGYLLRQRGHIRKGLFPKAKRSPVGCNYQSNNLRYPVRRLWSFARIFLFQGVRLLASLVRGASSAFNSPDGGPWAGGGHYCIVSYHPLQGFYVSAFFRNSAMDVRLSGGVSSFSGAGKMEGGLSNKSNGERYRNLQVYVLRGGGRKFRRIRHRPRCNGGSSRHRDNPFQPHREDVYGYDMKAVER